MSAPTISVIIPAYNAALFIEACLRSCIAQTHRDFEVVVVNDGSTDATPEIVKSMQESDARIKLISKKNEGVNMARKTGIDHALGIWLFFLDADDTLPENALQALYGEAMSHDADLVAGNVKITELDGSIRIRYYSRFHAGTGLAFLEFILGEHLHYLWGKLIRHSLYTDNEILFSKELVIGEDQVQLYQLCMFARKVCSTSEVVYEYRKQIASATQSGDNKIFARNQEIFASHIHELKRSFAYPGSILQQLNFRIIFAFHQATIRYGKRYHQGKSNTRVLRSALYEGIFADYSLLKKSPGMIVKGFLCLIAPAWFYHLRNMYHRKKRGGSDG